MIETQPYVFISTSIPLAGLPVLGNDGVIHILARGFKFNPSTTNFVSVKIDGKPIVQNMEVLHDGTVKSPLKVPQELSYDQHVIHLIQKVDNEEIMASSTFVKAAIDPK